MKVPYGVYPDSFGSHIYSATFGVSVAMPARHSLRTKRFEAIIDSGATRCMFHADIGRFLGLDLKAGDRERTQGIGGPEETWIHQVSLFIPGGPVTIFAAFKENLPVAGLLGMNGFFEYFNVTFLSQVLACDLERVGPPPNINER